MIRSNDSKQIEVPEHPDEIADQIALLALNINIEVAMESGPNEAIKSADEHKSGETLANICGAVSEFHALSETGLKNLIGHRSKLLNADEKEKL